MSTNLSDTRARPRRFGLMAALAVVLVTSIPQLTLSIARAGNWNGSYAILDYDELTYSAYLNALIQGRGRTTNPFSGSGDQRPAGRENYYSIQFVPPYLAVGLSKIFPISSSTTFILMLPLMAFLSSLSVFWLLDEVSGDEKLAAIGVLIVLLCGRLVSENPLASNQAYATFAFLRRYVPAIPFPFFFVFGVCIWRTLLVKAPRAYSWSCAAGLILCVLIFSYFYLWTAALALLACVAALSFLAYPKERRYLIKQLLFIFIPMSFGLLAYFYLLSQRARTIDTSQAFELTHAPDLLRVVEITGVLILFVIAWMVRKGRVTWRSPIVIFSASCALAPMVVFNQQVITGRSLQPFHYEQFIINYVVLIAVVLTYKLFETRWKIRTMVWILFALTIGLVSAAKEARDNFQLNVRRDEAKPVFQRIDDLARSGNQGLALFNNSLLAASAPTLMSVGNLWSPNMYTYGDLSSEENVERFYQYLYYLGVDAEHFRETLQREPQTQATVFGLRRANARLESNFRPVSAAEIDQQVQRYSDYISKFAAKEAKRWPLSYVVILDDSWVDFARLDRWYVRDGGQQVGRCTIYLVQLRE